MTGGELSATINNALHARTVKLYVNSKPSIALIYGVRWAIAAFKAVTLGQFTENARGTTV
jgi:hypothetical protein